MNSDIDFYAVLGILPSAEAVVVTAAYRALATRYHPDRWSDNSQFASNRMAEINVAYGVLGDAPKRSVYDKVKSKTHSKFEADDAEKDSAFDAALADVEERWQIAVSIFPDLDTIRKRLAKTAHRLAFAFVTVMLETKQFTKHITIADAMEQAFLQRYFGSNSEVILFAKALISEGHKDATFALNQYVEILGSDFDAAPLIAKIEQDFKLEVARVLAFKRRNESAHEDERIRRHRRLKESVKNYRDFGDAVALANIAGYGVRETRTGFWSAPAYELRLEKTGELFAKKENLALFVDWVSETICPLIH